MEIDTTGKDIGTRQPFERELCTVCTTTNGFYLGLYIDIAHSLRHEVDDVNNRFYFLAHVVVLVFNIYFYATGICLI